MNNQPGEQTRTAWRLPETLSPQWLEAGEAKALTGATVHVWRASLDLPAASPNRCFSLLAAEERERAARFYRDEDRDRFIVARGTLRILLSRYLNVAPESITLNYNSHGKPFLADSSLHFNSTRRRELALYAFALRPVGIDVELEQATQDFESLLPQVATTRERTVLQTLPVVERHQAFLHLWTRKEALLKAVGTGFAFPPAQFSVLTQPVEMEPDLPPGFDVFRKWTAFVPESGFLATLATRAGAEVNWFQFSDDRTCWAGH
ncbi:MAG TPA: 4'-phosphopantetheinyl transferase superfamily protein [Blastocatellia bacterium]|nr:4'-phosphopantetheinyl transferase superfamily protein [Blastocatellia bacterium]HMX30039.1 4'-phosphopantetheinyl transferase superfamily protein [Blastocatellia bacterium]HMY74657.1 4'-phosphopantetheinyl transferase superfamily protein [Blastocatellia bacterium]HMZ22049.1 4'-phosphopantetheinyl transferase superfamily protein [Blastocatellia bacterium]HNG33273.1 4'-phosphopantetheinyl transferase superfamily protein [Blastocatellia bacterium]